MFFGSAVASKYRAAAIPAKTLGHPVSIVRLKNIFTRFAEYFDVGDFKHCTGRMAASAEPLAILAMAMRNYYRFA